MPKFTLNHASFEQARKDTTATVEVARFYDTLTKSRSNKVTSHEIGWTIRVSRPRPHETEWGGFHVHWKPPASEYATYPEISAHFKSGSHAGNRSSNRNTSQLDLKLDEACRMYNGLVLLNALWDQFSPTKPTGASTGWTRLDSFITEAMVNQFRQTNNDAALRQLGQNPLYDLNRWEKEAWSSYLWWMVGA